MASIKLRIHYELDTGESGEVTADQRDFADWELHPHYAPMDEKPLSNYRFLSWSAAKRAGVTRKPYEWWLEHCAVFSDPDDAEPGEVPPGNPTQPGRSAAA